MIDEKPEIYDIEVQPSNLEFLAANRIQVVGQFGSNNRIIFTSPAHPQANISVRFNGYSGSRIALGAPNKFNIELHVYGDETQLTVGKSDAGFRACVYLYDRAAEVQIGSNCAASTINVVAWGSTGRVVIGDNCMFAFNIWLRASDEHCIIDFSKRDPIQANPPRDILIDSGVWIGQDALILKGASIGRGSIIGARSLVSTFIPEFVLATGSPARILKTNVTWSRHAKPTRAQMQQEVIDKQALPTVQN